MWPLLLRTALSLGGGDAEPRDDPWRELDRAVAALASGGAEESHAWGVLVRAFLTHSDAEAGSGTAEISGATLEDVDAFFSWRAGDAAWRISADLDEGEARLEDAHARWRLRDGLALTAGQFKPRVVRSGSVAPEELLFRERTFLGAVFDAWDDGVELGAHAEPFDWWLALTDGSNGAEADHFLAARAEWALYDAAFEDAEGARDAPNHLRVLLGACWFADDALSTSDGGGFGADVALTFGPYAFHGEWAELDDAFARTIDVFDGHLLTLGDGEPFSATLSRRLGREAEAALRFERADDADSTEAVHAGASFRPGGGPARLVADLARVEGDTRDFSLVTLGLQIGSSGLSRPWLGGVER